MCVCLGGGINEEGYQCPAASSDEVPKVEAVLKAFSFFKRQNASNLFFNQFSRELMKVSLSFESVLYCMLC